MRRHQVARPFPGLPAGLLLSLALLGCAIDGAAATTRPSPAAQVAVTTATGEVLAFEPTEVDVVVPSAAGGGVGVEIIFENRSSLSHNLTFIGPLSGGSRTIVEAGTSERIVISPPKPGAYPFVCTVHDGMAGLLTLRVAS